VASFDNIVHYDDQTRRASHAAGAAIIRAIREAFYGLEGYEFSAVPDPILAIARFRSSAEMFGRAAYLYGQLSEVVPERSLDVSEEVTWTFKAAIQFHQYMGGAVLPHDFVSARGELLNNNPILSRALVQFARSVAEQVEKGLTAR
jgi:hypothetical protein